MQLRGKTVLVTGASSGLGRALSLALAARGNAIVATARRGELLESLRAEIEAAGGRCVAVAADAAVASEAARVLASARETFGPIDVAILNAGGGKATSLVEAEAGDVLGAMRTNYDTLVNYLLPLVRDMRTRGGTVAYTGSPAGYMGLPRSGPYSAAKAAGRVLFDTCRIELAHTPMRFVALYPGFTYTDGLDPNEVPVKALIIDVDRAVGEMIGAIERGAGHHMFPKRIAFLIALARLMPEPIRRRLLALGVS